MTGPGARDPLPGEEPEYSEHLARLEARRAEREHAAILADDDAERAA